MSKLDFDLVEVSPSKYVFFLSQAIMQSMILFQQGIQTFRQFPYLLIALKLWGLKMMCESNWKI